MKPKNQESKTEIVKVNGGIRVRLKQSDLQTNHSDATLKEREKK